MIPIAKPLLGDSEKDEVMKILESGMLAHGKKVEQFEKEFADYIGVKHAIATSSGTAALHTLLAALKIGKGKEVITTPFSFIASSNSLLYNDLKPVFIDIKDDFNIDEDLIKEKINDDTRAILLVHLFGNPCQMDRISEIANDNNLMVIEDACQAHGAEFKNRKVGSFGNGAFSFYPTKNMTSGEGGMITTDDPKIAKKAALFRNQGMQERYFHKEIGHNFRMTNINAAIGIEQLKRLDDFNDKRIKNAEHLAKGLKQVKGILAPKISSDKKHVFHQFSIRVTKDFSLTRQDLIDKLQKNNIGHGLFYPVPIYRQEPYKNLGYKLSLPVTERTSEEVLSLPVHPSVSKEDIDIIVEVIKRQDG